MEPNLGTLYIVATPIGNLEDITLRAIKILSEVDVILAEDTRVTFKLLNFLSSSQTLNTNHQPFLISYHQHSNDRKKMEILQMLLQGKNLALVTDAGTPGISDPGNELIGFILENAPEIKIVPIPGPSALITALSVSGMNINSFVFLGFLPKKGRTKVFSWLKEGREPFAFYESPFRILKTLDVLEEHFGRETKIFIARELTKMYESLYRGTLTTVRENLKKQPLKGEIVVIVDQ
jgi:16S rRNA (cytidine1402-2'-O)-methyltransferase